jgi:Holliday junction resolvase RusA-like endonuclease
MNIFLPFLPPSVNSCFYTDFAHKTRHKSAEYRQFIRDCKSFIKGSFTYTEHIGVEINLFFGTKRKNDIDNRIKPVLDMLTYYGVIRDDALVTRLVVEKYYRKGDPETRISVNGKSGGTPGTTLSGW